MEGIDIKELGSYGVLLMILLYTVIKGVPKLWTLVTGFVEAREAWLTTTMDRMFKHADEDRALFIDQMNSLKSCVATELQKERDFHGANLRDERQLWEQLLAGRYSNGTSNGNGNSAART